MTYNYRNYTGHPHTITTKREERCECDQCLAGFRCVIQRMVSITYNHTCRPLQKRVPRVCYSRCLETNLGAGWLPNIWKYSPPLAVTAEWRPVLCYLSLPVNVKVDTTVPCYRSLYSRQELSVHSSRFDASLVQQPCACRLSLVWFRSVGKQVTRPLRALHTCSQTTLRRLTSK